MNEKFNTLEFYNFWNGFRPDIGYKRQDYTDNISHFIGNKLIKVLVGQRRAGKSFLLRQIAMQLIDNGTADKNIFFVNCELAAYDFLKTYQDLNELFNTYLERIKPQGRVFLFIDEIQNINGWEKFVNSVSQDYTADYEVFISGSNSEMLSGELATLLSGRYVQFEVFPLSYREYCDVQALAVSKSSYINYLQNSGLPELQHLRQSEVRQNYVSALKDTILLRDIIQRHRVKDVRLLEDVFVYLANNISNLFSIQNIVNYFKSKGRRTSYDTVATYIGYMQDTYLVHKAERYNIRGKETVAGVTKFYINDLAFNNLLYQGFGPGTGYLLENLVYLEFRRKGYNIYVGTLKSREIDFVAIKGDTVIYSQCAYLLADKSTIDREYTPLEAIDDNYDKWVITLDDIQLPSNKGIKHIQAWQLMDYL